MLIDEALGILDHILVEGSLSNIQEKIFIEAWEGYTYSETADRLGYDADYIRELGAQLWQLMSHAVGEKVSKRNFKAVLTRWKREHQNVPRDLEVRGVHPEIFGLGRQEVQGEGSLLEHHPCSFRVEQMPQYCWGETPDLTFFLGREQELETLTTWVVQDRCRLIGIFGIGGIGKTALAAKLAQEVREHFDFILWKSLRNAPHLRQLLGQVILCLSDQRDTEQSLPQAAEDCIAHLNQYLKLRRCLLVLDNAEAIFQIGDRCGQYRQGYHDYEAFFRQSGECQHQSCLLVTSREKLQEFSYFEGECLPVRSIQLAGVQTCIGKALVQLKGDFYAGSKIWKRLVDFYSGNPLALKIVAATIHDLFDGEVEKFLEKGILIFDDIDDLLDEQFCRLPLLEQRLMYWLAIEREPIQISVLEADLLKSFPRQKILEGLKSLVRRSLVYKTTNGFTQQSVVMEYLVNKLCRHVTEEIIASTPELLIDHALLKAQGKEYIYESQKRVVIEPICQNLLNSFDSVQSISQRLQQIVHLMRDKWSYEAGYSVGNILNLMQSLNINACGLDFSGVPIRQVNLQQIILNNVNLQDSLLENTVLANNLDYAFSVAIDPEGKFIATGGVQGIITFWHFPSMEFYTCLTGHCAWITQLSFSSDRKYLASASTDSTVRIWQMSDTRCIATLREHTGPVFSARFSPSGMTLVTGGHDGTVKFWDTKRWVCRQTIKVSRSQVGGVDFSPDGLFIACGVFDGQVVLYDTKTFQRIHTDSDEHSDAVYAVVFHPDGQSFFTSSFDRTIKVWDRHTFKCLQTYTGHTDRVTGLVCSTDGKTLASGSLDQTIRLWDLATGQCQHVLQSHNGDLWDIDISPNNQIVASVCLDHTTKLWDVDSGLPLKTLHGSYHSINSVAFSPDGECLLSGGEDRKLRLWSVSDQTCIRAWSAHANEITTVAFHPQGQILGSGAADQTVKLWDAKSGECLHSLKEVADWVWSIAFSPDGRLIAGAGRNTSVHIWDVQTGEYLHKLTGVDELFVWSLGFSPDGKVLASGNYDCKIKLWDTQTWQSFMTLAGHEGYINSVHFSPQGHLLASGSYDFCVKIWDTKTGMCLHTLRGHQSVLWSVVFSPDGSRVASAGFDGSVKIWNVQTGQCLTTLVGHTGGLFTVSFHPNGRVLASSSRDGTIRLWDLESGECLSILRPPQIYEGLNITGIRGITEQQKSMLLSLGALEKN